MEKIEWAVFVKDKGELKQYSVWENIEFAKIDFKSAKEAGHIEVLLMKKVISEYTTLCYRERNGHFMDGITNDIEDIK